MLIRFYLWVSCAEKIALVMLQYLVHLSPYYGSIVLSTPVFTDRLRVSMVVYRHQIDLIGCINRWGFILDPLMFMIHASKILLLNIMLPQNQGYLKIVVLLVPYYGFGSSFLLIAWWTIAVWYISSAKYVPSVSFAFFLNNTWLIVI